MDSSKTEYFIQNIKALFGVLFNNGFKQITNSTKYIWQTRSLLVLREMRREALMRRDLAGSFTFPYGFKLLRISNNDC